MPKPTTDASWEVEISEKTDRPIRWNGQNWEYYKKLMGLAVRKKDVELFKIMKGDTVFDENWSAAKKEWWEGQQLDFQEIIFSTVCTDMGQQLMELKDGSAMWKFLRDRYEGTANDQTRAMTKRQLYAQLEAARCKPNGNVE
ncbi:hypothetical protein PF005_g811 [Phytophthora fragariae]|uniref:Uncharacterized protein n=1 Tax=Phytophthora fragariae TaxID=53985 RepID=A0A6A3MRC8_9STRA|nr:hypothetical protein PF009_g1076 [Phytophthora fragariae]KAE9030523.1 hypothetical protein PF011_g580 [Phytophthora fragariae]KAE9139938.1 hypothetical protein PF007_g854 [Phytophthora fragariae]KAE9155385.1 hypothetical protein PF006_g626 [Phytophthora fragariae]KAE9237066.1 hypothetical protein PF005_g811 [Phytophthora fragariae]